MIDNQYSFSLFEWIFWQTSELPSSCIYQNLLIFGQSAKTSKGIEQNPA